MPLKDWERDVISRQRNIVFPDTVLNEGRFYRNIVYGKAVRTLGQRLSLLFILVVYISLFSLFIAAAVAAFLSQQSDPAVQAFDLWTLNPLIGIVLFWIFVAVKGLFPVPKPRRRRRGYLRSSIQ